MKVFVTCVLFIFCSSLLSKAWEELSLAEFCQQKGQSLQTEMFANYLVDEWEGPAEEAMAVMRICLEKKNLFKCEDDFVFAESLYSFINNSKQICALLQDLRKENNRTEERSRAEKVRFEALKERARPITAAIYMSLKGFAAHQGYGKARSASWYIVFDRNLHTYTFYHYQGKHYEALDFWARKGMHGLIIFLKKEGFLDINPVEKSIIDVPQIVVTPAEG